MAFSECLFVNSLNLDSIRSKSDIYIKKCRAKILDLTSAVCAGSIILNETKISDKINATSLSLGKSLYMNDGGQFGNVYLRGSRIKDNIDIQGSQFDGELDLSSINIGNHLNLNNQSVFLGKVNLTGSIIKGQIDLTYSLFTNSILLSSTEIFKNIIVRGITDNIPQNHISLSDNSKKTIINDISMVGCYIGGAIEFNNTIFLHQLEIDSTEIKSDFSIIYSNLSQQTTRIIYSHIGKSLKISSSSFKSLDISGTKINGDLDLGRSNRGATDIPPIWQESSVMICRNTEVGYIQDLHDAWPNKIDLQGFTYKNFGGFRTEDADKFVDRNITWMKNWLGEKYDSFDNLDQIYPVFKKINYAEYSSIQPYLQLSKILMNNGYMHNANEILYAAKEKELHLSESSFKSVWLILQKLFVGYGFKLENSLYIFLILLFLGTFFFIL